MSKNKFINFNIEKLKNNIVLIVNENDLYTYKIFKYGKIVFIITNFSNSLDDLTYNDFNVLSEKFISNGYKIIMVNDNKLEHIKKYIEYFTNNEFDDLIIIYNCESIDLNKLIQLFYNNVCKNILLINNYCNNQNLNCEIPKNCCVLNVYQNESEISTNGIIMYYLISSFDKSLNYLLNDVNIKLKRFNQHIDILGNRKYLYI